MAALPGCSTVPLAKPSMPTRKTAAESAVALQPVILGSVQCPVTELWVLPVGLSSA